MNESNPVNRKWRTKKIEGLKCTSIDFGTTNEYHQHEPEYAKLSSNLLSTTRCSSVLPNKTLVASLFWLQLTSIVESDEKYSTIVIHQTARRRLPYRCNNNNDNNNNNNKRRYRRPLSFLFLLTVFIMCCSFIPPLANATDHSAQQIKKNSEICPSLDIRNSVESFKHLADCRVIEGFLQIVLMDRTNESHFTNLAFPKLQEITGYLLLYRVNGLRSLSKLFPNLSVIRGHHLFINYALAVYEMLHLQELGLHSLIDIPRGAVFITKNPLLCYVDTIDWTRIATNGKDLNLISENRQSNACPKCPVFNEPLCAVTAVGKQPLCWNSTRCQRACPRCLQDRCAQNGDCCHDYCLGGCYGTSPNKCFACKNVFLEDAGHCVAECPYDYFRFRNYRCIKDDDCYKMSRPRGEVLASQTGNTFWKTFNRTCIYECPPGYEETKSFDGGRTKFSCEQCKGACRKVCDSANVDSIQSAQRLKGCVIINGSLEIQIRGGGNIVKELEDNLNMIEEITGYLKVVRSISLVSLNFLRRLHVIHGNNLESGKYALIVLDNQNLAELWDFKRKESIIVKRGRIFFHFNPKLCLDKIRELQEIIGLKNVDDLDVARNSNGDKVACNIENLQVSVSRISHSNCVLTWIPYTHYEMRTLLGYVIYVMEAPHMNISMNDGRDACGGDSWKVYDVEVRELSNSSANENMTQIIPHLKPYTLYAYYIKTYTIASETNGAQSKIQYFRTRPSTPSPPRDLKVTPTSSNSILIEWLPPDTANGNLTKYVILVDISKVEDVLRNYCTEPIEIDKKEKEETKKKTTLTLLEKKNEDCPCAGVESQTKIKKNDQEVQALIEFENKLQDSIYVKNNTTSRQTRDTSISFKREIGLNKPFYPNTFLFSGDVDYKPSKVTTASSEKSKPKALPATSPPPQPPPPAPPTVNNDERQMTSVPSNQHNLTISNLKHFSEYTVSIQACRETMSDESINLSSACSQDKVATVQTNPLEEADKIDYRTIKHEFMNNTGDSSVKLSWDEPNITNGKILTYQIRYTRVDIDNQQAALECITQHQFNSSGRTYILRNLHPGNYSLTLRATSLAKDNKITPPIYFFIKETNPSMIHQIMLIVVSILIVIVLVVIVMCIMSRYFYAEKWDYPNNIPTWVNPEYFKAIEGYDQWDIPRRKVQLGNLLGIGHFGEVYEGRAKGIVQKGVFTKVAIKTLSKPPSNRSWANFLNEATVMKQFDTHHVVRLLGVVTKGGPLVIMELMSKGDLRTYLRSCRTDILEEERKMPMQTAPTLKEILRMAAEIADGMLYLSDKKFVHRDLAARNCLINEEGTVKIGDFGLTRDVYETDYYRKDSKGHLPVRWMAPESLRDGIFTSRSDVWSFGVVLWEMATLASLPYTGLGNGEVMPYVINGGTMDEPENCPPILAEIMKLCWQYKYSQRPTFSFILEILLPNLKPEFAQVSYYHSEVASQLRANKSNTDDDSSSPYTPLRKMEDIDDFSLEGASSDDDENIGNRTQYKQQDDERIKMMVKRRYDRVTGDNNLNIDDNDNNDITATTTNFIVTTTTTTTNANITIATTPTTTIPALSDDDDYEDDDSNPNQLLLTDDKKPGVTIITTGNASPSFVTVIGGDNCNRIVRNDNTSCRSGNSISSISSNSASSNDARINDVDSSSENSRGSSNCGGHTVIINSGNPPTINGYIHRIDRSSTQLNDLNTFSN